MKKARRLRREQGCSVKEIAGLVGVSRSTASRWVRDVELTGEQREALRLRNPAFDARLNGSERRAARYRALRERWQDEGRALARRGEALHAAGCMLYWAEGEKSRNRLALANSDPEVLRFFVAFLRAYFAVPSERLRVRCNLLADHLERQREVEQFWLDVLELPRGCLWRSAVNVYSRHSARKRLNTLPYGTCKLILDDTRVVQSIFGAIHEYAGFERPEWLG